MEKNSKLWKDCREFFRTEALLSSNPDALKKFLGLSDDAVLWPMYVNRSVLAVAVTIGSKIESLTFSRDLKEGFTRIALWLLDDMDRSGLKFVWMEKGMQERCHFPEGCFEDRDGFFVADFIAWNAPHRVREVEHTELNSEVDVSVQFRQPDRDGKQAVVSETLCKGIYTAEQYLYLDKIAAAFSPINDFHHERTWVSVSIDGIMQAEYRLRTRKSDALGMRYDPAGTPFISVVDLFAPTVL